MVVLAVVGLVTNVFLAGTNGQPALGTTANVSKSLSVSAVTGMTMLILGILVMAGEFRHRTILATYLGRAAQGSRPRRQAAAHGRPGHWSPAP